MSTKKKAPFIVIEALDAGGSQTQTNLLVKRLKKEGKRTLQLHFPHEDRATGRLIYDKFLLNQNKKPFTAREQVLLFVQDFFSRSEDITRAISAGTVVVSDRFYTSTMAYQTIGLTGANRKKMMDWITWLCVQGTPALPKPDRAIFLDTPVEVSLKRLRGKKLDFHENRAKLTKFRDSYIKLAKEQKWLTVNSVDGQGRERSREELHQEIWQLTAPLVR